MSLYRFQFHRGAIQTQVNLGVTPEIVACFNSIEVRFKHELLGLYINVEYGFQFHRGAIQTSISLDKVLNVSEFQFHRGAIQTARQLSEIVRLLMFQFHRGAIQTMKPDPCARS